MDWIYTPLFCKAICNRKARTYGKKNRKIAKKGIDLEFKVLFYSFVFFLMF